VISVNIDKRITTAAALQGKKKKGVYNLFRARAILDIYTSI